MSLLCALSMGTLPFAFTDTVNGAIIAGIFSVVNTILNLRLIRHARRVDRNMGKVKETAKKANEAMIGKVDHIQEIEEAKKYADK